MKKAIILAAGVGSRIKKYHEKPKALLKFGKNKITIIERLYRILKKKNFSKITVITGFRDKLLRDKFSKKDVKYIKFKNYKNTNNLQSLLFARKELNSGFFCFFSDLIFDEKIIDKLLKIKGDFVLAIDSSKVLQGTMRIKLNLKTIKEIGNHVTKKKGDGNFIGIAKFSKRGANMLKKYLNEEKKNKKDYYTIVFNKMISSGQAINYYDCEGYFWKEIDTISDFNEMKKIIIKNKFKY
jgi:choline kinase